uniref:Uncharacterized protein n=1 Tax=viral metagenome TaxID=1070528 RepID=A0A6C0ILX4_9ZZZZ
MDALVNFYNIFKKDHKKERFDIILEPLQAMSQLAFLAFYPKGSKLSINNNLIFIQTTTWTQGLLRTYNHDKRDDVFFLFNAIMRFNRFYAYMREENDDFRNLFELLITLGKLGIDNLLQTYANCEQASLLHTLQMYRTILEKPDVFSADSENSKKDIDEVFIKIRHIYTTHELNVLYNTLLLVDKNPEHYETYMTGLNAIMQPKYTAIKKWINDNIVY